MDYRELIEKVLKGRSVNATAKALGIPQPTLSRYVSGERIPDYEYGFTLVKEAGIGLAEGFEALAEAERNYKISKSKKQHGFVQIPYLFIVGGGGIVAFLSILCQIGYP